MKVGRVWPQQKIPRPSGGFDTGFSQGELALVVPSTLTTVLDATLARILLLVVWTLATALLSALMSRVLLLLTRLVLSTMLGGALATLLLLLVAIQAFRKWRLGRGE